MSDNSAAKVAQSLGVAPGATASLDTTQQLQTLNNFLTLRTFVAGHQLSDADKTYFNALKASKLWGGNGEAVKAKTAFPHLLRWFEHLCHLLNEKPQAVAQPAEQKGVNLGHQGSFDAIQLENAVMGKVVTRFPPEPSGYLHAGHLKACLMNDFYARKYNGRLLVRFDDTNPAKARDEYVEAIKQDLKTLEIQHEAPTFTSDYFGKLTDLAIELIKLGKAYVDLTPKEEIKIQRNEGVESKYRNTTPEENLKLFQEMVNGTELGQKCVLRAKIDMQHTNRCLRDPAIVRCNLTPHYRQGSKYKAYALYDFACPLIDSLEGVTHALRSNEYHDKNPLYYWVLDTLAAFLNNRPQIEDFSRLNFAYVLLSKRKLQNFVDKGAVDGWNDPRFPTIQGILRRGLTLQALREFVVSLGAAKTVTNMSMDKLWAINKQILDPIVPRYTAIETPRKVLLTVTNVPDTVTEKPVLRHKKNAALGEKQVLYSNKAWLEGKDVDLIKEGEEVTLMDWGNVIIKKKEVNGDQVSLTGEFNPSGNFKNTQKFTWVAAVDNLIPLTLVTYGYLITVEKIPKGEDFDKYINPQSKVEVAAVSIPNITELKKGDRIQLERKGYYICDVPYTPGQPMVLVNIPYGKQSEEDKKKEAEKKKEEQPKQAKGKAAKK